MKNVDSSPKEAATAINFMQFVGNPDALEFSSHSKQAKSRRKEHRSVQGVCVWFPQLVYVWFSYWVSLCMG